MIWSYMYCFTPIPYDRVHILDTFWSERLRVNQECSLPKQYEHCKDTGRLDALRLNWKPGSTQPTPHIFWDSDTAKWLEAACYACRMTPDPALREKIDAVADLFINAQQPDGYLNSHFITVRPQDRWKNLRDDHELYCAGHMMEAAVAHYELTGERTLLQTACRLADCIDRDFGRGEGQMRGYCGHPNIEQALIRLFQATGEPRYQRLATYFVDERGQHPHWFAQELGGKKSRFGFDYYQAHMPVREQAEAVGHAVRAIYLYTGMTDVAALNADSTLLEACKRLWESVTQRKMYVTGGIGSSWNGETFTNDYDLPNERAYCETCASVALAFWAWRMLQLEGDAQYAEILERALYNGALAGMSLDGQKFFYQNPLVSLGKHHRQEWFHCACCPSNLSRLLGTLGNNIASFNASTLLLHLYVSADIPFSLPCGVSGRMHLTSDLPWKETTRLQLKLDSANPIDWELRLRIPHWADSFRLRINGEVPAYGTLRGYACLQRCWQDRDTVDIEFAMPVRTLISHPHITGNSGQIALQRGPFIYCIEDADFPNCDGALAVSLSPEQAAKLQPRFDHTLLGGISVLEGEACITAENTGASGQFLYRPVSELTQRRTFFRAIPYFAWDNRGPGTMRVWIPTGSGAF